MFDCTSLEYNVIEVLDKAKELAKILSEGVDTVRETLYDERQSDKLANAIAIVVKTIEAFKRIDTNMIDFWFVYCVHKPTLAKYTEDLSDL